MYNVQVDENLFFTGNYAKVGSMKNGVSVDKLPPSENSLCYKLVDVEVSKEEQQPILQYTKFVNSETEFNILYSIITTDEEGNDNYTSISEEEYNALSDEDKEKVEITQIPKTEIIILSKEEYDVLSDAEKEGFVAAYKEDETGELVCETVIVTEIVKDWEFSQAKYEELEAIRVQRELEAEEDAAYKESISNETLKAENAALTEQVDILTMCLLEMSELVYA